MGSKTVFVTVGTTKFETLIEIVQKDEILNFFKNEGYDAVQFQTGIGNYFEKQHPHVNLLYKPYFENFEKEIKKADLVISHAGAGTCLEVLKIGKPLIVVINEELMDNHQIELASQLAHDGYLLCCTCSTLEETLRDKNCSKLKSYPKPDANIFGLYLNKCMGFS